MSLELEIFDHHGELIEVIRYDGGLNIISIGQYSETKGNLIHYEGAALNWLQENEPFLWSRFEKLVQKDFEKQKQDYIDAWQELRFFDSARER
jgi:hypothetical protein